MKKLVLLGFAFTLLIASASAQSIRGDRNSKSHNGFNDRRVTPGEKFRMKKNDVRYHRTERKFKRDGRLSRMEKRKLYKMKRNDRHDAFRYKHNRHRRSF